MNTNYLDMVGEALGQATAELDKLRNAAKKGDRTKVKELTKSLIWSLSRASNCTNDFAWTVDE